MLILAPLREAALAQGKTDMINFWSGQNTANLKHTKSTELMAALIAETTEILRR